MTNQLNIFEEKSKNDYQIMYDNFYKGNKEMWGKKLKIEDNHYEDISILIKK